MARKKKAAAAKFDSSPVGAEKQAVTSDSFAPAKHEKSESDKEREGDYDLDHLLRAEEIKGDEDRMKYVRKAHGKKHKALTSIAELKEVAEMRTKEIIEERKKKA